MARGATVWILAALLGAAPGCGAQEEPPAAASEVGAPAPAPPAPPEPPSVMDFEGESWQTADPAAEGLDPERLRRGVERVAELGGVRTLLVARNGRIVLERSFTGSAAAVDRPHDVKSASKSLLSALVGIALDRGEIPGLDAPVAALLPRHAEGLPADKRKISFGHLLSMRSGLASTSGDAYGAWVSAGDWTRAALARPLERPPGQSFAYSTGSSHLVGAIVSEATGESLLDYAREHLAGPLGVEIHSWQRSPEGYFFGGNSVRMTPRDLAKLGQLYLQEGRWNGRQVVPAEWVRASTRRHAEGWPNRYGAYGYLWWLPPDDPWQSFAAIGYGGQFLYVVPELRMLVVTTATLASKGEAWDRRAFEIFRDDLFGAAEVP